MRSKTGIFSQKRHKHLIISVLVQNSLKSRIFAFLNAMKFQLKIHRLFNGYL